MTSDLRYCLPQPYDSSFGSDWLSSECLYGRLFSAGRYLVAIEAFLILTLTWLVSFLFAAFFQVWRLSYSWMACTPMTNYTVMYVCVPAQGKRMQQKLCIWGK